MRETRLIVMAGLPGSGKSSVAEALGQLLDRAVLSVDPIEAAMWRSGIPQSMTGIAAYHVAEAIAEENLRLGLSVIIDAVNPVDAARDGWVGLAARREVGMMFVESHLPVHASRSAPWHDHARPRSPRFRKGYRPGHGTVPR
jgi:predicted kinase